MDLKIEITWADMKRTLNVSGFPNRYDHPALTKEIDDQYDEVLIKAVSDACEVTMKGLIDLEKELHKTIGHLDGVSKAAILHTIFSTGQMKF